jgi:hypothetical protein
LSFFLIGGKTQNPKTIPVKHAATPVIAGIEQFKKSLRVTSFLLRIYSLKTRYVIRKEIPASWII